MPRNRAQSMVYALVTIVVTVTAFIVYNLCVLDRAAMLTLTGADRVLDAVRAMGGVYMCARYVPIWAIMLTECFFAYVLDLAIGGPCSVKIARRNFDPKMMPPHAL